MLVRGKKIVFKFCKKIVSSFAIMEHIGTMRHRQDLNNVHPNSLHLNAYYSVVRRDHLKALKIVLLPMVKSGIFTDKFASFSDINRKLDATPDPNTGHVHYVDPTCDRFHGD